MDVDCLQYDFVIYRDKLIITKREVIPTITNSMIPVDFIKKPTIINFTTDDMTSKFEFVSNKKINAPYLTESMQKYWPQMLDEYWHEGDTPYSGDFISVLNGCFNITINQL